MIRFLSAFFIAFCAVSCAGTKPIVAELDAFEAHTFQTSTGATLPYRLLRPKSDAQGPFALVVLFHGSGAIGDDNRSQIGAVARSWATADAQRRFPAYVLVPQFPARTANYTPGENGMLYSEGTPLLNAGLELIQHIRAAENIDPQRVYAIGFSMGGSAVWNALAASPGLFSRAAIVGGIPAKDSTRTGDTKVLLVHGDKDDENPFAPAWNAYMQSNGRIEFWRFHGLGHEFPPELIATDRLREWLFRD